MFIGKITKRIEKDNWENGCIGGGSDFGIIETLTAENLEKLVNYFAVFVGVEKKYIEYDEFNNDFISGRTENDDGENPTEKEFSEWKSGKIDLWSADYFMTVFQTSEISADEMKAAIA